MRRNSDETQRAIARRYLAAPGDPASLREVFGALRRVHGFAGAVEELRRIWLAADLVADNADLDVLAETIFADTTTYEQLLDGLTALERAALQAEAQRAFGKDLDELDQDQRAPWWRRERFHEVDGWRRERFHEVDVDPEADWRLYSPARGSFLIVKDFPGVGWTLVERPIESPVEGFDSVLVDMAIGWGPGAPDRRPLSAWSLGRILRTVRDAEARPTFRAAAIVPVPHGDPTVLVESVAGAPAHPAGRGEVHVGRPGPYVQAWDGPAGRVVVYGYPLAARAIERALWENWRVGPYPWRVRLGELRISRRLTDGQGVFRDLEWVGRGDKPAVLIERSLERGGPGVGRVLAGELLHVALGAEADDLIYLENNEAGRTPFCDLCRQYLTDSTQTITHDPWCSVAAASVCAVHHVCVPRQPDA